MDERFFPAIICFSRRRPEQAYLPLQWHIYWDSIKFFYQQIRAIQNIIGFSDHPFLLNDLVIMRFFEDASKLRSLELLEQFFGINIIVKAIIR